MLQALLTEEYVRWWWAAARPRSAASVRRLGSQASTSTGPDKALALLVGEATATDVRRGRRGVEVQEAAE